MFNRVAAVLMDSVHKMQDCAISGDRDGVVDHMKIASAAYNDMLYYIAGTNPVRIKQAAVAASHEGITNELKKVFERGVFELTKFEDASKLPGINDLKEDAQKKVRILYTKLTEILNFVSAKAKRISTEDMVKGVKGFGDPVKDEEGMLSRWAKGLEDTVLALGRLTSRISREEEIQLSRTSPKIQKGHRDAMEDFRRKHQQREKELRESPIV